MANGNLMVDDEYCQNMGNYLQKKGCELDRIVTEYINILQEINNTAIMNGETAEVLSQYIECCRKLEGKITYLSNVANQTVTQFLSDVDTADDYLF